MATNFPTSLDALTNPGPTDPQNAPSHSAQHANANDAIEALEAKVGVDSSAVTTSLDYLIAQANLAIAAVNAALANKQGLDATLTSISGAGTTGTGAVVRASAISGFGSGTVTNVGTGTGLTGGPITGSGTISLGNTDVIPGSYGSQNSVASFRVDQQGRLQDAFTTTINISHLGDVTGLATETVVSGIHGKSIASPTTGFIRYNGTSFVFTTDVAPLASPSFTGTPVAPTATAGTNTTQIATTAFVQTELAASVPTTITVADTTDSTCWVALFESATGNLLPKTDGNLTYSASSGTLTSLFMAPAVLIASVSASSPFADFVTTQTINLWLRDTGFDHLLQVTCAENLTTDRTLDIIVGNANRTLTFTANASIGGTNTGDQTLTSLGLSANGQSLVTAANYAAMRALLDLEAGTDFYSISAANAAFQPIDADLTAISALSGTNTIYYRSGAGTWTAVTIGSGLDFTGGSLTATGGGTGTVTSVSVVTANGVSGSVANATTTPAITLTLGAITPTTVNGNTITTGTGTLTLGAGKTFTLSNTLTLAGTDGSTLNVGTGGTLGTAAYTAASAYQPLDATLTAFAALTIAANSLSIGTGADAFSQTTFAANKFPARASTGDLVAKDISDFALTILDDTTAGGVMTTLGITANGQSLITAANYAAMRGLLDLEAGTDFYSISAANSAFQPLDTQLTSLAGLSYSGNALMVIRVNAGETGFELAASSGGVPTQITVANEATDTTCFPLFVTAATGDLGPKTNAGLAFNSNTGVLTATGFSGPLTGAVTGNASTATALATARAIYGNNFDGTAALTQVIASTYGGTGNGFAKLDGPATTEKTFTLPNATCSILTTNAAVTVAQGGTGLTTATAYAVLCGGTTGTGAFQSIASVGTAGQVLKSNGAGALPTFQTNAVDIIVLEHQETTGTDGGTFTLGADRTATINTEVLDAGGHCSLSSNQFTLAAGTYRIRAWTQGLGVLLWSSWLYNVTDTATELMGSPNQSNNANVKTTYSFIEGEFTIAGSKVFEIRKRSSGTRATSGYGVASGFGAREVYTRVVLEKVA